MLSYTMDVEPRSTWLISTPSDLERNQAFYCSEVGAFYARDHFATERSSKDSYILFYTLDGEGFVEQDDQGAYLGRGSALLLDCRRPQRYRTSPRSHHWYHLWAHVDGLGIRAMGSLLGLPGLAPVGIDLPEVRPQFDVLLENLAGEGGNKMLSVGLAVHELLSSLAVAHDHQMPRQGSNVVSEACSYIEAHFAEPLSLSTIAGEVSLSQSQLIRLFKARLGTTPHSFLLRYRITRAKELLGSTSLPVGEVSRRCGFSSESSFSYRFGKVVGQSPSAYRSSTPKLFG
jgi:AraC-like DNA-binding protein